MVLKPQNNAKIKSESEDENNAEMSCTRPPGHVSGGGVARKLGFVFACVCVCVFVCVLAYPSVSRIFKKTNDPETQTGATHTIF